MLHTKLGQRDGAIAKPWGLEGEAKAALKKLCDGIGHREGRHKPFALEASAGSQRSCRPQARSYPLPWDVSPSSK